MKMIISTCLLMVGLFLSCNEKQIYESEPMTASPTPVFSTEITTGKYEKYTGTYKMAGASFDQVVITHQDGKLFAQASGEQKVEIYPEKENSFQVPAFSAKITFTQEADSTFSGIIVLLEDNELKGLKK